MHIALQTSITRHIKRSFILLRSQYYNIIRYVCTYVHHMELIYSGYLINLNGDRFTLVQFFHQLCCVYSTWIGYKIRIARSKEGYANIIIWKVFYRAESESERERCVYVNCECENTFTPSDTLNLFSTAFFFLYKKHQYYSPIPTIIIKFHAW